MSSPSETTLAFAHPSERAAATAIGDMPDRLMVRDHVVEVEIGAFQAERNVTQRVSFNVVVEIAPLPADVDDDVDRILSYDKVTEAIAHELAAERLNLLETLAERIADRILLEPQATRVFVRIEKLDRGPGRLGVEIVRKPGDAGQIQAEERPSPVVMYLSNPACSTPHLGTWIDQLTARGLPLVICVGPHDLAVPGSSDPVAQRRIDLLSVEQNAWSLVTRDPRCAVVGSRTELDWGMKNGQTGIWAPSRIVLDAVDGPSAPPEDPVALAAWFAAWAGAAELIVVGEELPPVIGDIPARLHNAEAKDL
jgi:dihydroneopterin aldolase